MKNTLLIGIPILTSLGKYLFQKAQKRDLKGK
jgi:hypothetical protein